MCYSRVAMTDRAPETPSGAAGGAQRLSPRRRGSKDTASKGGALSRAEWLELAQRCRDINSMSAIIRELRSETELDDLIEQGKSAQRKLRKLVSYVRYLEKARVLAQDPEISNLIGDEKNEGNEP